MRIDKVMHRDVQIIGPKESLRNAAALMKKLDAGALPVSEHDKLIGMITDRDIAIRGIAEGKRPDATVQDVMSREVKYCFEDEEVAHVVENMAELQVRRFPNPDKRLVGIVSLGDLAIQGSLPKTARALHGISQPGGSTTRAGQPDVVQVLSKVSRIKAAHSSHPARCSWCRQSSRLSRREPKALYRLLDGRHRLRQFLVQPALLLG